MFSRAIFYIAMLSGTAALAAAAEPEAPARAAVKGRETAFAATLAARDYEAFCSFVSEDAVFFSAGGILRGKDAVCARWRERFRAKQAPFSWEPDTCEVLASGDLAMTSGPVRDPEGRVIARFASVWRREKDGVWRIVFDKGEPVASTNTRP